MILNKKEFLSIRELLNSDKDIQLKKYEDGLKNYNTKKNLFGNILRSQKPEQWEELAAKVILDNIYLGHAWKLAKIQKGIDDNNEKIKDTEITQDERTAIQNQVTKDQTTLRQAQTELQKSINVDLEMIKKL